jgi:hypothetical protein
MSSSLSQRVAEWLSQRGEHSQPVIGALPEESRLAELRAVA